MNLSPIVNDLLGVSYATALACVPVVVHWAMQRLKLDKNTSLERQIDSFATDVAGMAYHRLVQDSDAKLTSPDLHNQHLSAAVDILLPTARSVIDASGLSSRDIVNLAKAKLGQLLAVDPNASVEPVNMPQVNVNHNVTMSAPQDGAQLANGSSVQIDVQPAQQAPTGNVVAQDAGSSLARAFAIPVSTVAEGSKL